MATKKAKTKTVSKSTAKKTSASVAAKPKTQAAVVARVTTPKQNPIKSFFAKKYEGDENLFNVFNKTSFLGALIGEIIGVFILTVVFMTVGGDPLYMMFGIVGITVVIYSLSGAHLNPIITIGAFVTRRISAIRFIFYIIAQVIGAMLAYVALKAFLGGAAEVSAEAAAYGQQAPELLKMAQLAVREDGVKIEWYLAASEFLGAAILAFFFARGLQYKRSVFTFAFTAGVGIFAALMLAILTTNRFLGISGGFAMNPALAVALETFNGAEPLVAGANILNTNIPLMIMIFAGAPLLGGIIGFLVNDLLARTNNTIEK